MLWLLSCTPSLPGVQDSGPPPQDSTPVDSDLVDSEGACDGGVELGVSVPMTLEHQGVERTWALHLPADYDCSPRPMVLGLHGYYGSGEGFEQSTSRMFQALEERGWIGVFPDGLSMSDSGWKASVTSFNDIDSHNSEGPDGPTCTEDAYDYDVFDNCPASESEDACNWGTSCADDEGFLRALIERVQADHGADGVFLTGFSQGGQTTQAMAWRLQDVLDAAAPHHGFATNGYTVGPTSKLSLFQVWGDRDRVVDGHDQASNDGMIYDGADETAAVWAEAQGCAAEPTVFATDQDGIREWSCVEHADCATGASVVSCVWDGGHTWGRTQESDFALDAMFDFFATR